MFMGRVSASSLSWIKLSLWKATRKCQDKWGQPTMMKRGFLKKPTFFGLVILLIHAFTCKSGVCLTFWLDGTLNFWAKSTNCCFLHWRMVVTDFSLGNCKSRAISLCCSYIHSILSSAVPDEWQIDVIWSTINGAKSLVLELGDEWTIGCGNSRNSENLFVQ